MSTVTTEEKYRRAVATLAANCGARVESIIAAGRARFTDAKVRELAGTAPEYQRHVIGRAAAGDPNPFHSIAATLLVYDNVAFKEVTSRLHRALGMIRKEVAVLERATEQNEPPRHLADRLLTLDLAQDQAGRLHTLLTNIETVSRPAGKKSRSRKSEADLKDTRYAAAGLGLIAKNVRNVAVLQSSHLPTAAQKELALQLTADARAIAVAARDAARRAFDPADAACRVRPVPTPTRRVITHAKVDGDAVAAAWLAERFLFAGEPVEVLFVPRERVWGAWRAGDCLVDVGNTHDPASLFFDHKPPACTSRHDSCAARMVWDRLVELGRPVRQLGPLVDVVYAGDSTRERVRFKDEYAASKRNGFHKALADAKAGCDTDADVYRTACQWLDAHARRAAHPGCD